MFLSGSKKHPSLNLLRMPLVDAYQMRAIDALSTRDSVEEGYRYMCLAGQALFRKIMVTVPHPGEASLAIFTGGGNNGGDGLVLARLLQQVKMRHQVFGLVPQASLRGEAARALADYLAVGGSYRQIQSLDELFNREHDFTLVVDAMLGIGQEGSPRGLYAEVVRLLNQWELPVLAVDCPTGFDCQAGVPGDPCLKVRWTLMLGFPRLEAFCIPGGDFFGETEVALLGYAPEIVQRCHAHHYWMPAKAYAQLLPPRNDWGDKRVQGYVGIIAGSVGMAGAAALCAQAALRCGVGMVHLAAPESIIPALSLKLTEPVLQPLPCEGRGVLEPSMLPRLEALCDRDDALCIGPGISAQASTRETVRQLIKKVRKPLVLDADGINAIAGEPALLRQAKAPIVITPHAGEWGRLFGPAPLTPAGLLEAVRAKAQEFGVTIVLKGPPTFVGTSAGDVYLVSNANSGMAKGGSGDVLAGIIAALLAQGLASEEAALLGVHLHNQAGRIARAELGAYGMLPTDMVAALPKAFRELLSSNM